MVGASREDSSTTGIDSTPNEGAANAGAAYVFVRSGMTWSQQAYLKPAAVGTTQVNDFFGNVAVSGDTVVIGASGERSSTTGINSAPDETAGNAGAAYVFVRSGTTWSQQAYFKPAAVGATQAGDHFGPVAVSGDTAVIGASGEGSSTTGIDSVPDEDARSAGAAYMFVRNGATWSQQAYAKPADAGYGGVGDRFGTSVAVSGDTVVVGAPREDSSTTGINTTPNKTADDAGAAYVFVRSGTTWSQQAYLKPAAVGNAQSFDYFGISVAASGDTVVVGANQEDSSTTGINSAPDEGASYAGAAYVFVRSGTTWSQQAYLKPAAVGTSQVADRFGRSVAVSGDTVVVGAYGEGSSTTGINSTPNEDVVAAGAAYVFVRSGTTWSQQAYLKPAAVGATQSDDYFGISVTVSGDTVVVGADGERSSTTGINSTPNESATGAGAAYVFVRNATTWNQQAYLKPAAVGTAQRFDRFGGSVAVSGDTVVVGASGEDSSTTGINSTPDENAEFAGAAYVFVRSGATWSQLAYLKPAAIGATQANDSFGDSVAVSGDTLVIGSRENSGTTGINSTPDESATYAGAAHVFVRSGTTWSQQAYLKPASVGTMQAFDYFGSSVAVAGDTVVVGAPDEDSNSTGIDSMPNERASGAGAFYVFNGFSAPEIAVEQPVGTDRIDGSSNIGLGIVAIGGTSAAMTFTIKNTGISSLVIEGIRTDGANAADFSVNTAGMSAMVAAGGSTSFSVTFTPGAGGARSATLHILSNDNDEALFDLALFGTALTAQQSWRLTYFGTTANSGNAADTADPDGDGANNLFEFVAGLVPTDPGSRFALRVEAVAGQPGQRAITFSPVVSGRTYRIKFRTRLTDATWTTLTNLTTSSNGSERTVTDLSAGSGPRFYRVEITLP